MHTHTSSNHENIFQTVPELPLGGMFEMCKYIPEMLAVRSLRKWICLNRLGWTFIP